MVGKENVKQSVTEMRVRPAQNWNGYDWREMWEHRELVEALVRRDLQARYRQTVAGVLWVLGQPLITTLVTSILLARVAGQAQAGIPSPLFVYVAMVSWSFISHALTKVTQCFIEHSTLVQRVYLPRLIIPFSVVVAAMADFGVTLVFLPLLMIYYHVVPGISILAFPLIVLLMMVSTFAIGLWLATLNAEFRDIAFALPFLLQLGLFVSPMFYSSQVIPLPWRYVYALNPIVGVVEGMRWVLLNPDYAAPIDLILISTFSTVLILLGGLYVFQRREPNIADVI